MEHTLVEALKQMVRKEGSQRAVARKLGISAVYLGDILLGRRGISDNVAAMLGYRREVIFTKEIRFHRN